MTSETAKPTIIPILLCITSLVGGYACWRVAMLTLPKMTGGEVANAEVFKPMVLVAAEAKAPKVVKVAKELPTEPVLAKTPDPVPDAAPGLAVAPPPPKPAPKPVPNPQSAAATDVLRGLTFVKLASGGELAVTETPVARWNIFAQDQKISPLPMESLLPPEQSSDAVTSNPWRVEHFTSAAPEFIQTESHPVVGVSYDEAVAFCVWLTKEDATLRTQHPTWVYRLPTIVEWLAALDQTSRFPWGDAFAEKLETSHMGNLAGSEVRGEGRFWPRGYRVLPLHMDGVDRTAPCGYGRQGSGLADMIGNVAEWCLDSGAEKPVMGTSWASGSVDDFDKTKPELHPADYRSSRIGFRFLKGPPVLP